MFKLIRRWWSGAVALTAAPIPNPHLPSTTEAQDRLSRIFAEKQAADQRQRPERGDNTGTPNVSPSGRQSS